MQSVPGRNVSARSRERERKGDPRDDNVSQWARSLARFFFFLPSLLLHRGIPVHRFVPVNGGERREREREKKEVGFVLDTKVALAVYSPHLIIFFLSR